MSETHDILAEYADGLIDGSVTIKDIIQKYDILPESDLEALLHLAQELENVLMLVSPSPEFVAGLRDDLLETKAETLLYRLRHLSRVQLAASIGGLTVAAGILWYARKSGLDVRTLRTSLAAIQIHKNVDEASALAS